MLEFQNTKTFFAKGYTANWSEEVFVVNEIKNTLLLTRMLKKLLQVFMKKNCKKLTKKNLE